MLKNSHSQFLSKYYNLCNRYLSLVPNNMGCRCYDCSHFADEETKTESKSHS